ncbi:uncharacterized protein BJ212DRAFT_1305234 [Suillus subaureus]|uniref:Uncharacterized protein n=1 Tax=Suillus subaureus TaxID=48587 RepID=A0A9P7DQL4_9AGAM|nr:uncharacterized protein BJ212DRAFT_1305234 [Suillus subaureus]KAG1800649.1 hypothetical protein BJ212DRAFT_1305234 [Suillus subaureus]
MSFTKNGVYTVRNIGKDLMLDLKDDSTWMIKKQTEPKNSDNTFTIQTYNKGYNGNGFFTTVKEGVNEPVVYDRSAFLVELVQGVNETYRISFTLGNPDLVCYPFRTMTLVKLANFNSADAYQQWVLTPVN